MSDKPKGILRNKLNQEDLSHNLGENLDRQEVIRNTRLNAQLVSESSKGDEIRAKLAAARSGDHSDEPIDANGKVEHLKWDEINLYKSEQEKSATMKIDEPKTPYIGGFNPQGEYYKEEDETIPDFELGQGEFDGHEDNENEEDSVRDGEVVEEAQYRKEKQNQDETVEEKHRRFEQLRKSHYHMKGEALKHSVSLSDEEDNKDQN